MSNLFPSAATASMPFARDGSLSSAPPPQEAHPPKSLGNNHIHDYSNQNPSYPPYDMRDTHFSLPKHPFTPEQPEPNRQHSSEAPSVAMVSSEVDYNHPIEEFRPYNPAQKPEVRSNRGAPKQVTPTQSPEGKPSSNGRRRTRTKVVAWDPNDLEDIYKRKEINKEEWDTICRDYPSRTRVAMRQQVIKMREKKQREAAGLGHKSGKGSTYSDSPQPVPNSIKWASVNGYQSSPADGDPYPRRLSVEGEESSDEFELSSAPDSDPEGKPSRHFEPPARSTPLQTRGGAMPDTATQQPFVSSLPIITQEGPQINGQAQTGFDVIAAQSRGQPIAPRQTLPQPPFPMSQGFPDDRQPPPAPPPPPPPPPPPEFRSTLRMKRGRDYEPVESETAATNNFNKRRKHQTDVIEHPHVMAASAKGYLMPFPASPSLPMPSLPPRVPLDSELDEMCIRFRDTFRMMKAYYEEEVRISKELYNASIGRANARATSAYHKLDEASLHYSEQSKEIRLSSQAELDLMGKKLAAEQGEMRKVQEDLARCRFKLTVMSETLERERSTAAAEDSKLPDEQMATAVEPSSDHTLEEKLRAAQENAERADAANNLLDEAVAKMRLNGRDTQQKFREAKQQHDEVTASIDNLVSKDPEDLPSKVMKKLILEVKDKDEILSNKLKEVGEFLERPDHLAFAHIPRSKDAVANGPTAADDS